ncbi:putative metal-dependent phosphoesterase TrpH [Clostridiales Family XIII bacterium PM5-7]
MKFDMHCHTKAGSIDSKISIEQYIELLKEQDFDGMLVTDHDSYKGYRYWQENKGNMPEDFTVLKGIEYDTKDAGHFLVIMPDDVNLRVLQIRGMSIELLVKVVHHFGGILGPAHPFGARSSSAMLFNKLSRDHHLIQEFDFLEGFNTCETAHANQLAQLLAKKYGKQCFGGSDAHKDEYVGMAFTEFDMDIKCNDDLIACVKKGGVTAFGGTERKFLNKHKKRHSFAATWGFKAYNRGLGLIFFPYRSHKVRKLALHH